MHTVGLLFVTLKPQPVGHMMGKKQKVRHNYYKASYYQQVRDKTTGLLSLVLTLQSVKTPWKD